MTTTGMSAFPYQVGYPAAIERALSLPSFRKWMTTKLFSSR
jgi:hypothetical protein